MAGKVKIAIGIPHIGDIPGYFFDTFLSLSRPADTYVIRVPNKPVDLARNMIVEGALSDPDVTHLFFMDADMQFHPDALFRLMQRDKDVIGGTYFMRTENPFPHVYRFHHEDAEDGSCPLGMDEEHKGDTGRWYRPMLEEFVRFLKRHEDYKELPGAIVLPESPDSLYEADALGTGAMLIKREVLEAVQYPWFRCHERSAGGEDFFFCDRAKQAGFGVWGDFSVQCSHEYKHVWLDRDDFIERWSIGKPDEFDFSLPMIVDASPKSIGAHITAESEAG